MKMLFSSPAPRTLLFLAGTLLLPLSAHAEWRYYVDQQGRILKAEFVSAKGDYVTLRREDNAEFTVRIDAFCRVDGDYIRAQSGGAASPVPATPESTIISGNSPIVIEALIDGPSELRIKPDGIYWRNLANAKPGKHEGQDAPTYINGREWKPVWTTPDDERGADFSEVETLKGVEPLKLRFKLLAVTSTRGFTGMDKRDEVVVHQVGDELAILIPDSQKGSRWYKFELVPRGR